MNRKDIILQLKKQRYTDQYIGNLLGLSKQRIHQIRTGYSSYKRKLPPKRKLSDFEKSAYFHHLHYAKEHIELLPKEKQEKLKKQKLGGIELLCELVRIRDNHTCQICGKVWHKGMRKFDVHHCDPVLEAKENKTIDDYKGVELITLCHKCHLNLLQIREKMNRGRHLSIDNKNRESIMKA